MMTRLRRGLGVAALGALAAAPTGATTLVRAGLDTLTASSGTIVYGDVLGSRSYWNADETFILTDVRIRPREVLKGTAGSELTVTLMGGSVGDRAVMVVGGAELVPGESYVVFVGKDDLPGRPGAQTVPEHAQGVFELRKDAEGGLRAVSQASDEVLVPDAVGRHDVLGGREGLALPDLLDGIRQAVAREAAAAGSAR
jgi:hypothetical protein